MLGLLLITSVFSKQMSVTPVITQNQGNIKLVKNLNFVAGMTRRFVSAKRLVRYFSNFSKLVEHRAQSPVREVNTSHEI